MKSPSKPTLEVIDPPQPAPRWGCVMCSRGAELMHKGTTYCRSCFDEASRMGRLIG